MLFKITFKQETHLMKMKEGQNFADLHYHTQKAFKKLPQNYCYVYLDEDGDQINLDNQHDFESLIESGAVKVTVMIKQKEEGACLSIAKSQNAQEYVISQEKSQNDCKFEEKIKIPEIKQEKISRKQLQKKQQIQKQVKGQNDQKLVQIPLKGQKQSEIDENLQKMKHNFVHKDIKCDICQVQTIIGIRYKCSVCDDYDLCQQCQRVYDHNHALIKIKFDGQKFAKQPLSALQLIGTTVYTGAKVLRKGFDNTVKTIRKISGLGQKAPQVERPKKIEDNVLAAIDKIKPLEKKQVEKTVQKKQLSQEEKAIKRAQYLSDILGIDFSRCYSFTLKHPGMSKQDLIVQYFNNVNAI